MTVQGPPWRSDNPEKLRWNADEKPLWLNFSELTILNLDPVNGSWPNHLDVVTQEYVEGSWVYLVITANATVPKNQGYFRTVTHPIHLHGRDFALLAQSKEQEPCPGSLDKVTLKTDKPPRRDVVLLPAGGYIVIAFKPDNPGVWLLHCHIAWHTSSSLAFHVVENKHEIKIKDEYLSDVNQTCKNWQDWWGNVDNHWDNRTKDEFQDDSGIWLNLKI